MAPSMRPAAARRAPALTVADEELAIERTMFAVHRGTTTEPLARLLGEFAATRP
ncbi:MAG: hypothetical protein R2710_01010 [Acidimicrobiales bacterium]